MNHKFRNLIFIFVVTLLLTAAGKVHAEGEGAKQSLQEFMGTLRAMEFSSSADALDTALIDKANRYLDLESMVATALSEHWNDVSDEQKKQFMTVMWKLIEKVAYPQSKNFLGNFEIVYDEPKELEKGYEILTVIKKEEEALDIEVVYLLDQVDDRWKVYDVILDGVSMIEDLSYQFETIITESSFDGLILRMNEKLAEVSKS